MKNCPNCNSSWIGDPIPQNIIEHYGESTHWQRELHIDGGMLGIYDGTVAIKCPDCKTVMPRNNSNWAKEMFDKYIKATTCEIPEEVIKINPDIVKYDGNSIKLIVKDEQAFLAKLKQKQNEISKDLENTTICEIPEYAFKCDNCTCEDE